MPLGYNGKRIFSAYKHEARQARIYLLGQYLQISKNYFDSHTKLAKQI